MDKFFTEWRKGYMWGTFVGVFGSAIIQHYLR